MFAGQKNLRATSGCSQNPSLSYEIEEPGDDLIRVTPFSAAC